MLTPDSLENYTQAPRLFILQAYQRGNCQTTNLWMNREKKTVVVNTKPKPSVVKLKTLTGFGGLNTASVSGLYSPRVKRRIARGGGPQHHASGFTLQGGKTSQNKFIQISKHRHDH